RRHALGLYAHLHDYGRPGRHTAAAELHGSDRRLHDGGHRHDVDALGHIGRDRQYLHAAVSRRHDDADAPVVGGRPTTNDERPTTNDQRPTTNDQRPTTNDQRRYIMPVRCSAPAAPPTRLVPGIATSRRRNGAHSPPPISDG